MRVSNRKLVLLCAAAATLALSVSTFAQSKSEDSDLEPLEIKPLDRVDETLFLMRFLETTYNNWPSLDDTSVRAARWAVDKRFLLSRLANGARTKKLDSQVIDLLEDCERLFQSYDDYLVEIGAVERASLERARRERDNLVGKGVERLANRTVEKWGEKNAAKKIIGETAGDIIVGFVADLFQQAERDAAKKRAIEYAKAKFEQTSMNMRTRAAGAARRIDKQKDWSAGEVGFENVSFDEQVKRRPRDPFLLVQYALIPVEGAKAQTLMQDARRCVLAACLVPKGLDYDPFRAEFLAAAGALATEAASREWLDDPEHKYGGALAKEAVRICRTSLAHDSDPNDWGKYDLAKALNFAGRHSEALNKAMEAKKLYNHAGFAYDYACLLSLDGQSKLALDWLAFSFKQGLSNVAWAKLDPELAKLRRDQAEGFNRLTKVQFDWSINYTWTRDNIVLTNKSVFPLTHVRFTPVIQQRGQTYTTTLTAAYISPGQSYTWEGVFSIPGSSSDSARGTLVCDQFGPFCPTVVKVVSESAADRAGFRAEDRIISYDGTPTFRTSLANEELDHLKKLILSRTGREVRVYVLRGGRIVALKVTVPEGSILGVEYSLK